MVVMKALLEKVIPNFNKRQGKRKNKIKKVAMGFSRKGNVTMQIFLGKNILGQQDRLEQAELDEPLVWSAD